MTLRVIQLTPRAFPPRVFLAAAFFAAGLEAFASTACSSLLLSGAFATLDHPYFGPIFQDLLTSATGGASLWIDEHYIRE